MERYSGDRFDDLMYDESLDFVMLGDFLYEYSKDLMDQFFELREILEPGERGKQFDFENCEVLILRDKIDSKFYSGVEWSEGGSHPYIEKGMKIFRRFVRTFFVEEEDDVLDDIFEEDVVDRKFSEIHPFPLECHLVGGVRGGNRFRPRSRRGRGVGRGDRRKKGRERRPEFNTPKKSVVETGQTLAKTLRYHKDLIRIPRLHYMTEAVIVDFVFHDATYTHTNNGVSVVSWQYVLNELEDVTPSGNNDIPGVTSWATFFGKYKVLKTTYNIDISNVESTPVNVVVFPSLTDLGSNYSGVGAAFGFPLATSGLLSGKGGMDKIRLQGSIDLGAFSGDVENYLGDPNWGGLMVGNVTNSIWLNVGGVKDGTFTTALGLDYKTVLTLTTLLYQRKSLVN